MEQIKILRMADVVAVTGVSRRTIYRWFNKGEFPKPVKLGSHHIGWRNGDVQDWLASREVAA